MGAMVAVQNYMVFINNDWILQACKIFELKNQLVRNVGNDGLMPEQRRNMSDFHFQPQGLGLDTVHERLLPVKV